MKLTNISGKIYCGGILYFTVIKVSKCLQLLKFPWQHDCILSGIFNLTKVENARNKLQSFS